MSSQSEETSRRITDAQNFLCVLNARASKNTEEKRRSERVPRGGAHYAATRLLQRRPHGLRLNVFFAQPEDTTTDRN